jgi:capsule polysaccharide export protein KpsC/LpsZ
MGSLNLLLSPGAFFKGLSNKYQNNSADTYVVGFSTWKQYLRKYFPDRNLHFLDKNISKQEFDTVWKKKIILHPKSEIFIWGFKAPDFIFEFARKHEKKIVYVEDGFIRSVGLGAQKTPPLSLTMDTRTPYFDARHASDLEVLLSEYNFEGNPKLMAHAKIALEQMISTGISKYNNAPKIDIQSLFGNKNQKRVLVIGQVEDDASILLGCTVKMTNNDLVRLAIKENPGAQIIYKPHPDVLAGNRPAQSNPSDVNKVCLVISTHISLPQSFHEVDHVYTLTSLGGFEALLRGIKVTTIGCPFYSGWGVTDDRQPNPRRTRKLSTIEIFAAAYLLYPKYFSMVDGNSSTIESVISDIANEMSIFPEAQSKNIAAPKVADKIITTKPVSTAKQIAANSSQNRASAGGLPDWFNPRPGPELKAALATSKPLFLYTPWIAGHGDALIEKISESEHYTFAPLDFVENIDGNGVRQAVLSFCRTDPALYRRMIINRLVPLRGKIKGVVFTFDWSPVMRLIAGVCEELHIPRILIPHESVFVDREKYYWDVNSYASVPVADIVLGWGGMQQEIFRERGYPSNRFEAVGAPKFDTHVNYSAQLTRIQYCRLFGLNENKKIILFASQPLDSQLDQKAARIAQRAAITDLLELLPSINAQLIVRLPPNKEDILGTPLRSRLVLASEAAIDDGQCYLVSPEEALFHSDLVTSINSTMLFEAILMNRPALSLKYVEFNQIWSNAGIPAVEDKQGLEQELPSLLSKDWKPSYEGMKWAANMFGIGVFDGIAAERIKSKLVEIVTNSPISLRDSATERLFNREPLDVIAIPSSTTTLETVQRYLMPMLNARTAVSTAPANFDIKSAASAEVFFQWGITETNNKKRQREIASELGRSVVYIEDGFIRSIDIGLSKEPGLSIILDDTTSYYDATRTSRLERMLQSDAELTREQKARARLAINKIVENRVSKYNHAPDVKLTIGSPERRKIMLIDQRHGDQSIESGLGSEALFDKMLHDALKKHSDCDILIKQHPDAIKGGKSSYFSNEKLAFTKYMNNVHPILFDVNPYALFDLVDEVYVMTSGMGFEALMAGKKVNCYGVPFYSGWGQTQDQQSLSSRTRSRSIEEIFFYSYIESSRYYDPQKEETVEVEDIVDYIVLNRDKI